MAKKSKIVKTEKTVKELKSEIYDMVCIHIFLDRDEKIGRDLRKGMKEGKECEPYYYFDQRLLGYCHLMQLGFVNYLDIIKYERDHCDDGGKYLSFCMERYGTPLHQSIICAFEPQNNCYFSDENDKKGLSDALEFIVKHLHKKMSDINFIE